MKNILNFIVKRKIISGLIFIILLAGAYFGFSAFYKNSANTQYVLAIVEKGTLINSVSGTGQVSALNKIDITPETSGTILKVMVKNGQKVKAGDILAQLDQTDLVQAVSNAEIDLRNANISLEQTKTTQKDTEEDLKTAYQTAFNKINTSFYDFATIMEGLRAILFGITIDGSHWNIDAYSVYQKNNSGSLYDNNIVYNSYHNAKKIYENNLDAYKSTYINSDNNKIKDLLNNSEQTARAISEAVKNSASLIQTYKDDLIKQDKPIDSILNTYISNLTEYTTKINTDIANLSDVGYTIDTNAGADPLSVETKQLSVAQKENALTTAKNNLFKSFIRAPFDGIVAAVNIKEGDSTTSATAIITIITEQQIAEITLNEVDAAKVKLGQKANSTFDAISNLEITGKVADIDTLGTVSQGVVTYNAKIVFDTQDDRVKSGMSVSTNIITEIKQDVLIIPNSAIKTSNGNSYIEMPGEQVNIKANSSAILKSALRQQAIQTGITNDTSTEIISGLKEGDQIITRTVSSGSASAQSAQTRTQGGIFQGGVPGGGGSSSGIIRTITK